MTISPLFDKIKHLKVRCLKSFNVLIEVGLLQNYGGIAAKLWK